MFNNQIHQNDLYSIDSQLTDQRKGNDDRDTMWDQLNLSQQYAVCSLGQFGYILTFVRTLGTRKLAILKLNDKVATINEDGVINISPVIACRQ